MDHFNVHYGALRSSPGVRVNRKVLSILSLGHLTVDIGAGGLPAILPFLQREFNFSYFWLAALVMLSGITSSIMQPIFGIASDSLRARILLPLGVLLALGGFACVGTARSYEAAAALVALAGVGSAMYHPEAAKSARTVSGRFPATANSVFSVGGNIGVALGPLIVVSAIAWRGLPGTAVLVVPALIVALVVASVVPAVSRAHEVHGARTTSPGAPWPKGINVLIAVTALRSAVYGGVLTFVPLYAVNVLHRSATGNGLLLFVFLGSGAVANMLAGPLADRYGAKRVMSLSLGLAPVALATFLLAPAAIALVGLALTGALIIGTLSTTVVMGMEYMPNRVALASALMIGLSTGLGGLVVGALGKAADALGLPLTLWMLVAVALLSYLVTLALPKTAPAGAPLAEQSTPLEMRAR